MQSRLSEINRNPISKFSRIWDYLIRSHISITDIEMRRQSRLFSGLLLTLVLTSSLASFLLVSNSPTGVTPQVLVLWVSMGISLSLYFLNRYGYYRVSAGIFLTMLFLQVHILPFLGQDMSWLLFTSMSLILTATLMPRSVTWSVFGASIGLQVIFRIVEPTAVVTITNIGTTIVFMVTGSLVLVFMNHRAGLERERQAELQSANQKLRESEHILELRVADRTRDLTIAAEVATQISSILDLNELLPQVVSKLQIAYDYYHVSVFLLDEDSQRLTLAAAAGRNNRKLSAMQFELESQGVVPKAARTRQPVFIADVSSEPAYYANPVLPDTKMEGSIPMLVGNRLIGVLDMQLDRNEDFGSDRLGVAVSLATQIGIAVQNARSYTEAEAARQQAIEASKIKSQFLANMSHELRTPMNAILNFTAFVADGTLGPVNTEQVQTLEEAIASGRHLLSLINDILDITKIEAGLMDLFIQDVDMNEVIGSVAAVGKGLVKDKPIVLNVEIAEELPVTYGDKRRLRQVFLNMLSNAVKFTREGQVTIRAHAIDNKLRVEIQDTGIGIAAEDQHLVFESFKQAKHDLHEAVGTGLGMSISKYFVESHGGKMWLTSRLGVGTTFYVELPVLTEVEANTINMSLTEQLV